MKINDFFVDMHCHPSMKPIGKSFNKPLTTWQNTPNHRRRNSLWFYNPPSCIDKMLSHIAKLTKFSQSDFSSISYGKVGIVCVSLYPIEKWFFRNKISNDIIADLVANFATGIGHKRIDYIQDIDDYFTDLQKHYHFYRQLHDHSIRLKEGNYCYRLTTNWSDIKKNMQDTASYDKTIISVILSIEGLHVLNTGLNEPVDEEEVIENARKIKAWDHRPLFVTPAHHFWNDLCGHAESLSGFVGSKTDQSPGMGTGWTTLGKKVLRVMLGRGSASRVHIDLKHMSIQSRNEYYQLLDNEYQGEDIPLIVSHGACNGVGSQGNQVVNIQRTGHDLCFSDINFYDDELLKIANTNGIFCLQLDKYRLASKTAINKLKKTRRREKVLYYSAALIWKQVQHIAELLDKNDLFAWGLVAIGSDFDGIIDPLKGFWTEKEMPSLADFLERHACNYIEVYGDQLQNPCNRIDGYEIISRIMRDNALSFLEKYYV